MPIDPAMIPAPESAPEIPSPEIGHGSGEMSKDQKEAIAKAFTDVFKKALNFPFDFWATRTGDDRWRLTPDEEKNIDTALNYELTARAPALINFLGKYGPEILLAGTLVVILESKMTMDPLSVTQ